MSTKNLRILLVEDEEHLLELITLNLEMEGYTVTAVNDGKKAIRAFKQERFNLIVLDVMLPEMDGYKVCQAIRLENSLVPILFLTAKNSGEDRIHGLRIGGDDYMSKPFNLEELLLRIQKLIKRSVAPASAVVSETFSFGDNKVNFITFEATDTHGHPFQLTKKEAMLLKLLVEKNNEVVSRETILESVWGYDIYPSTRTIDNFIMTFRKYFEKNPRQPRYFHSIRGVGYKFTE
jgi:two-component system alkaline phosphatase synthesis response regulator PhoP